jgi:hypothetical protein
VAQPGAFKAQMDRAMDIAEYLTTKVYGDELEDGWNTTEI